MNNLIVKTDSNNTPTHIICDRYTFTNNPNNIINKINYLATNTIYYRSIACSDEQFIFQSNHLIITHLDNIYRFYSTHPNLSSISNDINHIIQQHLALKDF